MLIRSRDERNRYFVYEPIEPRFWANVDQSVGLGPWGGCWEWRGSSYPSGYGHLSCFSRQRSAHHVAWFLRYGSWSTKWLLHRCDNRACVRVDHLFEGTAKDNTQDAIQKGRMPQLRKAVLRQLQKTSCPKGHPYVAENTYVHNRKRYCRTCARAKNRRQQKARSAARSSGG